MSVIRKTIVSNCEKQFLNKCLSEWTRVDRRAFDEYRQIDIKFGQDWGCCCVSLGKTRVLAQVSCEVQVPKSSRPSEGMLNINIELTPMAAPYFESGRQTEMSVQLNRLLEKCLKDSKAVDLESLCIKATEKVWSLRVDINVLNHEGNILDCSSIAALGALAHFRRPDVTCDGEEFIIHPLQQRDPIPTVIHHYPVCITYAIFNGGDHILVDPSLLEDETADAFLTVGLNSYKELCGLHLGGNADLSPEVILQTTNKAALHAGNIVKMVKEALENDSTSRAENKVIHLVDFDKVDVDPVTDLSVSLDLWKTKDKKNKKKNKQDKNGGDNTKIVNVEVFDKGAGTLIVEDKEKQIQEQWGSCSDDDADIDVQIIEKPVETLTVDSDDSEEERVLILNADMKTNKKKRVKK